MWERKGMESRWRKRKKRQGGGKCYHSKYYDRLVEAIQAAIFILSLYQNVEVDPKSSLSVFGPEYVLKGQAESTSLQTLAGNSIPHCLPVPTYTAWGT